MTDIIDDDLVEMVARTIDADAWAAIEDGRDALPDSMWDVRRGFAIDKARAALAAAVPVITARLNLRVGLMRKATLTNWECGYDAAIDDVRATIRALTKGETG